MIHHEKIKKVLDFLKDEFPEQAVEYKFDPKRKAEIFTLPIEDYTVIMTVPEEFFNDNEVDAIKKKLKDFRLIEFIRYGWSKRITVTKFGLTLEDY